MKHKWFRTNKLSGYIKSGDMMPLEEEKFALIRRFYTPKGKRYPLLSVSIYPDLPYHMDKKPLTGIKITCSLKKKASEWWDEYMITIPLELFDDLLEMLDEVKGMVK